MVNKNAFTNLKKHQIDNSIRSPIADNLRTEYHKSNARVIKGDTVKVLRGEYKNVEGKVERVKTNRSTLFIEGIQREASKGGKVKVQIHSSNVMITSLNLQDKKRENVIRKIKSSQSEKIGTKSKPKSAKTKIRRNLNVKKVLKTKSKETSDFQHSQDNKGDK
jgi:large subunit ribosomal protein L24